MSLKRKRNDEEDETVIKPDLNEKLIYLNDDMSSWVKIKKVNIDETGENDDDKDLVRLGMSMDQFEELWKMKPGNKLEIKIANKIIKCPRYTKSYLKAYKFSGLDHEADMNVPELVGQLLINCKKINPLLNQSLVNWYEADGSIGKHSDDTRQLIADSEIFSFSFGPAIRTFIIEPKKKNDKTQKTCHIELIHNTFIIMGGKCQQTHYHSVPKVYNDNNRRLNVTFRCFK